MPAAKKKKMTQDNSMKSTHSRLLDLIEFDSKIKKFFTHNKGFKCSIIDTLLKDIYGRNINWFQNEHCSQHLHIYTINEHKYAQLYSQESAFVLIIGFRNPGQHLDGSKVAAVNIYLSRYVG